MSGAPRSSRETPDTQRRRLRDALRRARAERDLTQGAVAEQLYWSLSKVIRIETGAVPVVPTDVQAMARLYDLDDTLTHHLIQLSRAARKQAWADYKDVHAASVLTYFGNESAARTMYAYESTFIPGLLQTPDYARSIFKTLGNAEADVERRLEVRLQRQQLLDAEDPPQASFVVDEAALCRSVGGREVMLAQLEHLKRSARKPNVSLQLLPFAAGEHRNMGESIAVLLFDDPGLPDMLYLEDSVRLSSGEDDPTLVKRYFNYLADLQNIAAPPQHLDAELDRIAGERFGAPVSRSRRE
jgi:transcriptional regulator with XRE-family HTH domain